MGKRIPILTGVTLDFTSDKYICCRNLEIGNLQDKYMAISVKYPTQCDTTDCIVIIKYTKKINTYVFNWTLYYLSMCSPIQEWFNYYKAHVKLLKVSFILYVILYVILIWRFINKLSIIIVSWFFRNISI